MTELREVFEMTTKQAEPDQDSWRDQERRQQRSRRRRGIGAFVVAAAIGIVALALILASRPGEDASTPGNEAPAGNPVEPESAVVGTVTFDGSTCSMEITADRIEPGVAIFDLVNTTDKRAFFDSYRLSEGFSVPRFAAAIELGRQQAEEGKPLSYFPEMQGTDPEVTYLRSETVPANGSGSLVTTTSPGRYAIVCMEPYPVPAGFLPSGVVGPIVVR